MSRSAFLVHVTTLRRNPGSVVEVDRTGPIRGLAVTGSRVPSGSDVTVRVVLEAVHGGVMAHGTVSAPWEGECRRCAGPAAGDVRTEVRELFEEDNDPEETYPLHGEQLDLEPLARDAVLLELPQAPLCHEHCKGLCAVCGTDRNERGCDCEQAPTDPRWAGLDALRAEE